jgi:hypothetical protein
VYEEQGIGEMCVLRPSFSDHNGQHDFFNMWIQS